GAAVGVSPARVSGMVLLGVAVAALVPLASSDDPLRWGLLYGLGALCGALAVAGRLWWRHGMGYAALVLGVGVVTLILAGGSDPQATRLGLASLLLGALAAV